MTPRRARDSLASGLVPICSSGTGAIVHLYAGVSPGAVIAVILIVTVLTSIAAIVPYLPELITARSMAIVRAAVLAKTISAADAAVINGDADPRPGNITSQTAQPPVKPQHRIKRRRGSDD